MVLSSSSLVTETDVALLRAISRDDATAGSSLHIVRLESLGLIKDAATGRTLTARGRQALHTNEDELAKAEPPQRQRQMPGLDRRGRRLPRQRHFPL